MAGWTSGSEVMGGEVRRRGGVVWVWGEETDGEDERPC